MNIVIYARFSSHNQTEQSIEGQLKVCYDFAERQGFKLSDSADKDRLKYRQSSSSAHI